MKLSNIATIRSGIVLNRVKVTEEEGVKYKLLTLKAINEFGFIDSSLLDDFYAQKELEEKYFTQEGDVVVRLRYPVIASYITRKYKDILVPAYFGIIKVKDNNFLPQYISAIINSYEVQKELEKEISGKVITMIKLKTLAELEIPEIPIEKQEMIAKASDLYIRDMNLIKNLKVKKTILYKGLFKKLLEEVNK